MKPVELAARPAEWLEAAGPSADFVLSSRVRLARNVADTRFPHRADEATLGGVLVAVRDAACATEWFAPDAAWDLDDVPEWERRLLVERHLASVRLAEARGPRGVCVAPGEKLAVMINEEDHLRIQSVVPGFDLARALRQAVDVDLALETRIEYAVSAERGYLTACPTNVGTGLRASILIHLPGLVLAGEIRKVHRAVAEMGMAVRGWFGEGSQTLGDFHQISNQRKLGWTEDETIASLAKVCRRILELEVDARTRLVADPSRRRRLEDRVHRSWALLRGARMATVEGVMAAVSDIRLGKWMNLFDAVPLVRLNHLALLVQPAHLGRPQARVLEGEEAEWARARFVRTELQDLPEDA